MSFFCTLMRQLLRTPKERLLMIIRCHHLREAGIMHECCFHCHLLAGCCVHPLPHGHKVIYCCGCMDLAPEAIETIQAKIPVWEEQEKLLPIQTVPELPTRFRPAYQAIQRLEGQERYLGAFIFGSVACGVASEQSTMDVYVIVAQSRPRHNRNQPIIGDVQIDLTFLTFGQFEERTRKEIDQPQRMRPVTIAESMIIFDKTGRLHRMREEAQQLQPRAISAREQQNLQSLLFSCRKKVEHSQEKEDPSTALLVMHMDLTSLLLAHYKQHQRWWVGYQRVFADLSTWDLTLADLVRNFLAAGEVQAKFQGWSEIIDHILQSPGGHLRLPAQFCPCKSCQEDISLLLNVERFER